MVVHHEHVVPPPQDRHHRLSPWSPPVCDSFSLSLISVSLAVGGGLVRCFAEDLSIWLIPCFS